MRNEHLAPLGCVGYSALHEQARLPRPRGAGRHPPGGEDPGGPSPGGALPYLTYVRKGCRLRPDQLDALTALARRFNRERKQKGERFTENTPIRWAVDPLLERPVQEKPEGAIMGEKLRRHLQEIARQIASFEDEESQQNRPAGSASGGSRFEKEVSSGVALLIALLCENNIAKPMRVQKELPGPFPRRLENADNDVVAVESLSTGRYIVFNLGHFDLDQKGCLYKGTRTVPDAWLKKAFPVEEWYDLYITDVERMGAVPNEHEELPFGDSKRIPFAGSAYKQIYRGLKTKFDGVILFIEGDQLLGKSLVEIKSAKSSGGRRIDGNAHERFSYQNLDYVEIGAIYPRTELLLLTNDAYVRYRNKYHTGFAVHALRLGQAFPWYRFSMVSSAGQYLRLFEGWIDWLEGRR